MTEKITIAIDGYSSSGKSTVAKAVAKELGYVYIDTGAMYRAVTLFALQNNLVNENEVDENALKERLEQIEITFKYNPQKQKSDTYLNGKNVEEEIRTLHVSNFVSPVSKIKFVREYLVDLQRKMGQQKGIVMDGRDIGTVVFPDAELKIFMNASAEKRAMRRYLELQEKGETVDLDEITKNIKERDHIDSTRKESPLRQAEDAILLDNSEMNQQQQLDWVLNILNSRIFED